MISPKHFYQLALYLVVGGGATLVEWSCFWALNAAAGLHYAWATSLAFAVSTFANWALGRMLLFRGGNGKGTLHELSCIYAVSIAGLLANLALMWLAIDVVGVPNMAAKIFATGVVFFGNFLVRKIFIYKI